jgi:pimeloyl-ACP methyl ester carboxylesterase
MSTQREPFYFKSADRSLFGWLQTPAATTAPAKVGIVVCKAFGYEAICSHRTVRTLADRAVDHGIPVLSFDYLGTGDSEDMEPGVDQLDVWTADVVAAIGELQRRTGVEQVCLLGLRLGATLALLAARQCPQVAAAVLVAPVVEGRRYVKELKTAQLVASLAAKAATPAAATQNVTAGAALPGSIEAGGYTLFPASIATLSQLDFNTPGSAPIARLLVIDRDDVPGAKAWSESLAGAGADVRYEALPGYVGMLMSAPQFAVTPAPVVAAVSRWLEPYRVTAATGGAPVERVIPDTTMLRIGIPGSDPASVVTERPLWLGKDSAVFAIVTEPRATEARRRAVIFVNSGADNHTGASRMHVSLARQWGAMGYVVVRLDLAGIGDSDTRTGRADDDVFPPSAMDDVRAAVDFVRCRYGAGDVTVGGICSGAYHSLRAAVAQLPVNRVLMVNPLNFFWDYRKTLQDVQLVDIVRDPEVYRERFRSIKSWRRVFAGQANIRRFAVVHFYRMFLSLQPLLRSLARLAHIRLPQDMGWILKDMDTRGVRTVMVFSRGEPGLELLRVQGGISGRRLANRCRIHIIDGADHTFTRNRSRAELAGILRGELLAPLDPQAVDSVRRPPSQAAHFTAAGSEIDTLH